ncbi:DUF5985 family protein [Pseudoduganella namucuonensis]|uniref:Uncharacterized protein n=1 Tax=Pseudoduganella namucuonensis TaxID=1035707 RepID=A0A1I7L9G3_9BURK|nr:DUF5985 family protein [Pseudoduganella namucuonensis]SFV06325.1 hypothetical protein SAMN05216552_102524 [Pseudoduganella namucuonensis]
MASIIYLLCAATALACAWMLLRSYRRTRYRLLLWSGLCFCGMFLNNVLLVLDRVVFPDIDLSTYRLVAALVALLPLLYGLVWEDE